MPSQNEMLSLVVFDSCSFQKVGNFSLSSKMLPGTEMLQCRSISTSYEVAKQGAFLFQCKLCFYFIYFSLVITEEE